MSREHSTTGRDAALERLHRLEREIHDLRRLLAVEPEELPARPFTALSMTVGQEKYAVLVDWIAEVVAMMAVRRLEESPPWILGTFRYGDEVVPLVDLGLRLQGEPTVPHSQQVVILSETSGRLTGFVVDAVGRLRTFEDEHVADPRTDIPQAPYLLANLLQGESEMALVSLRRLGSDLVTSEHE